MAELDPIGEHAARPARGGADQQGDAAEARLHLPIVGSRADRGIARSGGHSETQRQSGARHGSEPRHRPRHRGSVRRGRRGRRGELRRQRPRRRRGRANACGARAAARSPSRPTSSKRDEVEPMIERVWNELGPIDILVNNAGIETIVPFLELTDDQWTRLVDVNLRGAWLCSQVFCRRAARRKPARATSSTSDRSRRRKCCRAARTTRRRSSGSKR